MDPVSPGGWPLSAPATALLRDPRTAPHELLRLALRELVVRGAVRVEEVERRRGHPVSVRLAPGEAGAAGLPAPLPLLADALGPHLPPAGTSAHTAVERASGWRTDLAARVRADARAALRDAGLMAEERTRLLGIVPRTRWRLTPSGRAWARSAADPVLTADGGLPAAGLLLALDEQLQRRLRDTGVEVPAAWGDAHALEAVLGEVGPVLDAAADGASGGDDGGGGD